MKRGINNLSEEDWINEKVSYFHNVGGLSHDFVFWLSPRNIEYKRKYYWCYHCPVCSKDEYVQNNLCSGVFESPEASLRKGDLSCRCAKNYRWTQQQREYSIRSVLLEKGEAYTFAGWQGEYTHSGTPFFLNCSKHGKWKSDFARAKKFNCPECSKRGFKKSKPAAFYLLKVSNGLDGFVGYGISGLLEKRLADHKRHLKSRGYLIEESKTFHFENGDLVLQLEGIVKKSFDHLSINIEGFRRESAQYLQYETILRLVEDFIKGCSQRA